MVALAGDAYRRSISSIHRLRSSRRSALLWSVLDRPELEVGRYVGATGQPTVVLPGLPRGE